MSDVLPRLTSALENRYRIVREIGMGGMATVYLAHDLRHERDVAIKVLHPDLAAALGAGRFLAEIKTTAKLQHPHILPLLDSGEAEGLLYYVMPFIVGESLRDRLEKETQLAVDDAVRIAREVASALDYAHRHGVVHRDIKPENILIHEDTALVADFGIALAVSAAGGPRMTQTGLSLGTPAYMAPEQAMGERAIDGRADIYALGAVTYEMLVGEAPFTGPTVQAIVARVMTESPRPVTGQRKSVPAHVNAAVLRALEKLPADRFHSASEFGTALVTPLGDHQLSSAAVPRGFRPSIISRSSLLPWAIAGLFAVATIALGVKASSGKKETSPVYLAIDLPGDMVVPPFLTDVIGISPDGQTIAFEAVERGRSLLFLKRLGSDGLQAIRSATDPLGNVAFSPDGKWLVFQSGSRIHKMPVSGGNPMPIATSRWAHMSWIGNDAIVFTQNYDSGLLRVSAEGGDSTVLTTPDREKRELGHWWPQVLPGGEHVLFTNYTTPADRSKIEVLSLKTGKRQVVMPGAYYGRYVDGHLLFIRHEALMTVPTNPGSFKTAGAATQLDLDVEVSPQNGWAGFEVAENGTLVYRSGALTNLALSWVDDNGDDEAAIDSAAAYSDAASSPDGKKIAVVRDGDVWVYDIQRRLFTRLTTTDQREIDVVWSPDSREVFYARDVPQFDIFKRAADGSRPEQLVITSPNDKSPGSITPDGSMLLYDDDKAGDNDIYIVPTNPEEKAAPRPVISAPRSQGNARISPDGKWITFSSNESGRFEIYVTPYPAGTGPGTQQISNGGGGNAYWTPNGRSIYYYTGERIMKVAFDPSTGSVGQPVALSRVQPGITFAMGSDGRLLRFDIPKAASVHSLKVVLNWASTLGAKN